MTTYPAGGFEGFEDPEDEYYGPTYPAAFKLGYQGRQVGVGGSNTIGTPINILSALTAPPTTMANAAAAVLTENIYTNNDLGRYFPAAEYFAPTET